MGIDYPLGGFVIDSIFEGSKGGKDMKRRDLLKSIPAAAVLPAVLATGAGTPKTATAQTAATQSPAAAKTYDLPGYAGRILHSDMDGVGPDGKPTGQRTTFTGASRVDTKADTAAQHQMTLTQEEQDILNGSKGEELAKIMKVIVAFGNVFGAEKLVDLGGAPHSNMFIGTPYMKSMIEMLDECAKAGLKSYAPYTVNPRPYDVYNVQNNPQDMTFIYEGYSLQRDLDYVHVRLGAPDLNLRSCACYVDEIGNAPGHSADSGGDLSSVPPTGYSGALTAGYPNTQSIGPCPVIPT